MAHQGRGSGVVVAAMVLCFVVLHDAGVAQAALTYTVGDGGKGYWSTNIQKSGWTNGKSFKVGDTLVFQYTKLTHNVVKVESNDCSASVLKTYTSGYDPIKLFTGMNYFICNFPGHCENGMKIAINATARG